MDAGDDGDPGDHGVRKVEGAVEDGGAGDDRGDLEPDDDPVAGPELGASGPSSGPGSWSGARLARHQRAGVDLDVDEPEDARELYAGRSDPS